MSEQNACFQQLKYVQTGNRSAQIPPGKKDHNRFFYTTVGWWSRRMGLKTMNYINNSLTTQPPGAQIN